MGADPAKEERIPPAPGEGGDQKRPRRRRRGRHQDKGAGQGELFEEGSAPAAPPQDSPAPGQEAKKSRSKRRRERRKANKAADAQGSPGVSGAAAAPRAERAPEPTRPERREGPRPAPQGQRRGEGQGRRQKAKDKRGSLGGDERRFREDRPFRGEQRGTRPARPHRPEGMPPLSAEGLAAGFIPDFGAELGDEDSIPRYVTNVHPGPRQAQRRAVPAVRPLEILAPSTESLRALESLQAAIDESFPLQAKHRDSLRGDIRQLWEELTSDREYRSVDYLGTPPALSAYLRYFLPWNVFRLASILSNADFCLPDNAVIIDIGSGPLTLPIALWASRPELRDVPLTIYCMDRVERALEAGKAIFETFCLRAEGRLPPWRIELRKESFGGSLPERAHLLTSANVFNEFFWKDRAPLGERALATARSLLGYLRADGSLFIMEPGDPRSGAFISALRAALLAEGAAPLGPCPHALSCPMPGIFRHLLPPEETRVAKGDPNAAPSRFVLPPVAMPKKRDKFPWCHFGIDASKAPAWLEAVSAEAGLPKERAVLSYIWAARGASARPAVGIPDPLRSSERERRAKASKGILVRVVSEPFALPDGSAGQYACSSLGYTLVKRPRGEAPFESGALLEVTAAPLPRNDEKSGAIVLPS